MPPVISHKCGRRNECGQNEKCLRERHFIMNIPAGEGRKRKKPTRCCFVCSHLEGMGGVKLKSKKSLFWCKDCRKPLCITPCFKIYHSDFDYKEEALKHRVGDNFVNGNEIMESDENGNS